MTNRNFSIELLNKAFGDFPCENGKFVRLYDVAEYVKESSIRLDVAYSRLLNGTPEDAHLRIYRKTISSILTLCTHVDNNRNTLHAHVRQLVEAYRIYDYNVNTYHGGVVTLDGLRVVFGDTPWYGEAYSELDVCVSLLLSDIALRGPNIHAILPALMRMLDCAEKSGVIMSKLNTIQVLLAHLCDC